MEYRGEKAYSRAEGAMPCITRNLHGAISTNLFQEGILCSPNTFTIDPYGTPASQFYLVAFCGESMIHDMVKPWDGYGMRRPYQICRSDLKSKYECFPS